MGAFRFVKLEIQSLGSVLASSPENGLCLVGWGPEPAQKKKCLFPKKIVIIAPAPAAPMAAVMMIPSLRQALHQVLFPEFLLCAGPCSGHPG